MRKIKNSRSMKVLSAALLGVAALGTPAVAETVTVSPDMDGTELSNLNQMKTEDVRNFNFNSSDETYTVTKNLGTSTAGEININGIIGETAKSVIDFEGNTNGFVLNGDTTLNISNIEFKNVYTTLDGSVLNINKGTVNLTNVAFTNNVFESSTENASGPIFNNGKINIISGAFNSNGAIGTGTRQGLGGAIDNSGNGFIETINANFVGNYTKSGNNNGSYGGAIFNRGSIADINGNFTNNYVLSEIEQVTGGAISNCGNISSITGDFINNHLKTNGNALAYGAAIYNGSWSNYSGTTTIKGINGNFINNYSESGLGDAGGAIINLKATINSINGYFEGNYALSGGRASGGAIDNNDKGIITEGITANFKDNYAKSTGTGALARGGAVLNFGYIKHITGNFDGNYDESAGTGAIGGAIANLYGNEASLGIDKISGNYTNNHAEATGSGYAYGGAIYNTGTLGDIEGNFTNNYAQAASGFAEGGAIYNTKTIGVIIADFTDNYAKTETGQVRGGAIYNGADGVINSISGKFQNNKASSTSGSEIYGGAIYNDGHITTIDANFINNTAKRDSGNSNECGGAICNGNYIGSIKGTFDGNIAGRNGGAIANSGHIVDIDATFLNNKATSVSLNMAAGGALSNNGTIDRLFGLFKGNTVTKNLNHARIVDVGGAAIDNEQGGIIQEIVADFVENKAIDEASGTDVYGGAIYIRDNSEIGSIHGKFLSNSAISGRNAMGGAIYNGSNSEIGNIKGQFIGNYAKAVEANANGGAIINISGSIINSIEDYFEGNYALCGGRASGGAIDNNSNSVITEGITANFKDNYAKSTGSGALARGGAVTNFGYIKHITGDFDGNYAESAGTGAIGGAIANMYGNEASLGIDKISGNYTNNHAEATGSGYAYGGAIYNTGTLGKIENSVFSKNSATAVSGGAYGGAIYNTGTIGKVEEDGTITGGIYADFIGNNATTTSVYARGGAIYNDGKIGAIEGNFVNNSIESLGSNGRYNYGGAIYNQGTIGSISGNFLNNSAKVNSDKLALGGAVFSQNVDLNFTADNRQSIFSGNTTEDYRGKLPNAIFVRINKIDSSTGEETFYNPTITLKATNNGSFIFDDTIDGGEISSDWTELKREHQYNLSLTGDKSGKININNNIYNANISNDYVTTNISNPYNLSNNHNSLTVNSGTLNLGSLSTAPVMFESFAIKGGNINIGNVDVDLATKTMGRITANTYGESSNKGSVNVQSFNLLSDGENLITPVEFADKTFKNTVKSNIKEAYTKLYRYDVSYDTSNKYGENGYFIFQRGGSSSGNPSDAFNPAVLSTPITAQAGAQASITETFRYVFEHADAFTQLPSVERLSHINANQYALSTDYNNNLGPIATEFNNKAGWFRPYVTFENMNLKNGPKVDAVTYGSLVGFDSDFQKLGKGWSGLTTGYIGYNGSQLNYKGVDTTMNGGILGLTQTFYKGNFWSALTLSAGASVGQTSTMYGKEDFTSLLAGVGSKTGYNFEFKQGKFIVQPIMFMSYTFVNTFDYTNAAGVKINSDPMHTIQLNPSVRFIANTKTGWQPYASVGMVWNLLNETNATANGVKLPEMSMKPYVEYGLGLQRNWKDKFIAFGQAMIRNGGRNGIALTFGFRWALGKDSKPIEKVQGVNVKKLTMGNPSMPNIGGKVPTTANRTVLKQLTPTPKTALGTKPQNTTRTTNSAILKQL